MIHLGSNPALLGFISRPGKLVPRHTLENIKENKFYTINHINESIVEQAHYTSAKFDKDQSEFELCGLSEEYLYGFKAPFVKESHLKLGMQFLECLPIKANGTVLIIGEIMSGIFLGGIISGLIMYGTRLKPYLYINEMNSNKEVCSLPSKQQFKCKVYKDGTLVGDL